MDPADLADKLAAALAEIVPPTFRVYEEQGMVFIEGSGYRAASDVADIIDQSGDVMLHVRSAALSALSLIQDYIAEGTATPWPSGSGELPVPDVQLTSEKILLGFNDAAGNPALQAPPISW